MKRNWKNIILCVLTLGYLIGMGAWLLLRAPNQYSESERRALAREKSFHMSEFLDGSYGDKLEDYCLDQFPLRDGFRSVKATLETTCFQKMDYQQIYESDGYLSKMEYPMNESRVDQATNRINEVYSRYLKETNANAYLVIVPDKNYYMAEDSGHLTLDYEELYERVLSETSELEYVEIRDQLELEDYYRTDTHWKQEKLQDVAECIGVAMGVRVDMQYEAVRLDQDFYGVYTGQWAQAVEPDQMTYLTNDMLSNCTVTNYNTGEAREASMYNLVKASGKDPYEMYLEGATALITIENPNATSGKELVIFRDSFGSSLAPLLVSGYEKVTLVDLRYIQTAAIGFYVDFQDQDVLFEYSTLMINQGLGGSLAE